MFAAIGDGTYKLFLFLHLLAVIVGVGAAVVLPIIAARSRRLDPASRADSFEAYAETARVVVPPALLLGGLFGIVLILLSDDVYSFSEGWVSSAFALWIVALGLTAAVLVPAELRLSKLHRREAAGEAVADQIAAVRKRLGPIQGIVHLALVLLVVVMVWQPGH